MDTFATPGTPMRRGTIVHRASTDISIRESFSDVSPIIIQRLVDDIGFSIAGALDTFGKENTETKRSCTICRAAIISVPGSKISTIDDKPGIDSEKISS